MLDFEHIGSILVWAEIADMTKQWCSDDDDSICDQILTEWHDAVVNYDEAMKANHPMDALGNLYIIPLCLKLASPYITKRSCRRLFEKNSIGFRNIVHNLGAGTISMKDANKYMIDKYYEVMEGCW